VATAVRSIEALARRLGQVWAGNTSPVPLALFRVGLALLVLLRTSDWLWPWTSLDHYTWQRGGEFAHPLDGELLPRLFSPLVPLPNLPRVALWWAAQLRTGLAVLLLLGVRTRLTSFVLFAVGYGLMALDRYRYLHHLHLLWTSCLWLSLCAGPSSWSIERAWLPPSGPTPRWSLQLLRAQCLIVYAASGLAKLNADWLSGRALEQLAHARLVSGPLFEAAVGRMGFSALALTIPTVELLLVGLLAAPRLRRVGLALAVALHGGLEASMTLSTFGAQMALYLMLFLSWQPRTAADGPDYEVRARARAVYRSAYGRANQAGSATRASDHHVLRRRRAPRLFPAAEVRRTAPTACASERASRAHVER